MAADSDMEKTEDPTSKKLEEAANKGNIARSKELATALVLLGSSVGILIFGKEVANTTLTVCKRLLSLNYKDIFDENAMFTAMGAALTEVSIPLFKLFLVIAVAGVLGNILLGGYNFTWYGASFRPSKLNPWAGLKRMVGLQALVELFKSALKVVIVAGVAYVLLVVFFDDIMALSLMSSPEDIAAAVYLLSWMFFGLCSSMLIIAAVDAPYQTWNHHKQMMMTKQEVEDEYKNSEGNPEVKGRIRRMQIQMSRRRMMEAVPTADVIVTNPTHYAVALKYEHGKFRAPVVVAKGVDQMAMYIRQIADANKVPIVESPALARSIYFTTELDHPIPEQLFAAVAQVLAYVYQLKAYRKGKASRPKTLAKELPIPEGFRH
ncbi:flagellar biosynthesis protein FlhB [Rheinheimera sp. SA_1]|jgi:flagellar biosynthetic protein FlhB|uniref:flagellar biosynthesis protein FlhB n=1 Tax=Rheinheimera sp. SA_1 TaxID=1827365 RepID=UPI0007FC179C|nr:flagellar biosynthesis protein FlhB [Rheinheimera sp. SA_1]OBP15364.1 flagellar biosynthesis protein FlhB [Rheinheimera sp. SA_1]